MSLLPHEIRHRDKSGPRLEYQQYQMARAPPEAGGQTVPSVPDWIQTTMDAPAYVPLFVAQPENRPRSLSQSSNRSSKSSDSPNSGPRKWSISDILGTHHEDEAAQEPPTTRNDNHLQAPEKPQQYNPNMRISNSSMVSSSSVPSLASIAMSLGQSGAGSYNSRKWSLSSGDSNNIWAFDPAQAIPLHDVSSSSSDSPMACDERKDSPTPPAPPTMRPMCPNLDPPLMDNLELLRTNPTSTTHHRPTKAFELNPNAQAFTGVRISDDTGNLEQEGDDVEEKVDGCRFVAQHFEPDEKPKRHWATPSAYQSEPAVQPSGPYAFHGVPSVESIHSHHSHNSFHSHHSAHSSFSSRSVHSAGHPAQAQPHIRSQTLSSVGSSRSRQQMLPHEVAGQQQYARHPNGHRQTHHRVARSHGTSSVRSHSHSVSSAGSSLSGHSSMHHKPRVSRPVQPQAQQPTAAAPQRPPANLTEVIERKLVRNFAYEQLGSRYLQAALKRASPRDLRGAFDQLYADIVPLSDNVFGNYVIQKFLEHGSPRQRCEIVYKLRGHLHRLCRSTYGCRVVQKVLEFADINTKLVVLDELVPHVDELVRDDNGNHVIQKVIREIPCNHLHAVYECIQRKLFEYCTHMFGCRVVQRLLEHADAHLMSSLVSMVLQNVFDLCQDAWGNYVVQHVLENGPVGARIEIIDHICPRVVELSLHKFASNVVEKTFSFGSDAQKKSLLSGLLRASDEQLLCVICDQFGNYVVQKALEVALPRERDMLIVRINGFKMLQDDPNGARVLHKIQQIISGDADATS